MITSRFIKHEYTIINVKHVKNIISNPLTFEFLVEHGINKTFLIQIFLKKSNEYRKAAWSHANDCLCQFLSELDNEKTSFSSMFDFDKIFQQVEHEHQEEKEFEVFLD